MFRRGCAAALVLAAGGILSAEANAEEIILQWFENSWDQVETRMPDYFLAGYDAVWLPPVMQPGDQSSPGFDQFDKFDAGSPEDPTIYGTERDLLKVIESFHRAGANVYVDTILNHASGRSTSEFFLYDLGGYPGLWSGPESGFEFKPANTDWGDFHGGNSGGFLQSENPGGPNYDLFVGDLVALIDIAQESNNQFIRHPVDPGNPLNIPGGSEFNRVDEENRRFYPDLDLAPIVFTNPANGQQFTRFPFNLDDPMAGDPVAENATGLLMRHAQWMLEYFKVDGFRLDAIKHVPNFFWDEFFDAAVFNKRFAPDGSRVTPFSFGESAAGNSFTATFTRKDGFGNRDALDLNGAGQMRNLINGGGFGSWNDVLNAHLDNVDGNAVNGTLGVNHAFSHDNGSVDGFGSAPAIPTERQLGWFAHAYLLMRPGPKIVYHNSREMVDRFAFRGFWPDEGNPEALGLDRDGVTLNDTMTTLVDIANRYARGDMIIRALSGDQIVFERRGGSPLRSNVLVASNDRYDDGFDQIGPIPTSFDPGTVLVELTGNAADPAVDPFNDIQDTLTVAGDGSVTVRVPRNSANGSEHNKGYVIYGPVTPPATMAINGVSQTLPPSPGTVLRWGRRLSSVDVVSGPTFEIDVTTSPNGIDSNTDDGALFRVARGFVDLNNNGDFDVQAGEFRGWEQFLTQNTPLFTNPGLANGRYRQIVDTDVLPEGYNYINAIVFRQRTGGDPIFTDLREVIYVDRQDPDITLDATGIDCVTGDGTLFVTNEDGTATDAWVFTGLPQGAPTPALTPSAKMANIDRGVFGLNISGLTSGVETFTVVVHEEQQGVVVRESVYFFEVGIGGVNGDVNLDGVVDIEDLVAFESFTGFSCEADVDGDGDVDNDDRTGLAEIVRSNEIADIDGR